MVKSSLYDMRHILIETMIFNGGKNNIGKNQILMHTRVGWLAEKTKRPLQTVKHFAGSSGS